MVYSASAVVADERYQQPYFFLTKQVMWALLGLAAAVDHRCASTTAPTATSQVHLGRAGLVGVLLVAVLFSPADQRLAALVRPRRLGVQPSELAKIAAIFFTALHCSTGGCTGSTT